MKKYYLAIDIGASGGRHILGHLENGKMFLEELYRFPNGMKEKDGELIWDMEFLFHEILFGMKKCKEVGKIPFSIGIDTWAVDFVLLDKEDKMLGNAVGYRDKGTRDMDCKVYELISEDALYARTGIQKQIFNTIYQLMAWKQKKPELFYQAKSMLLIPDYLHYLLSGVKCTEYTNATTTQLVSPVTKDWDYDLLHTLEYPLSLFQPIVLPGTCLGELCETIREEVGYNCKVVVPATHDTASAVMSVPVCTTEPSAGLTEVHSDSGSDVLYISSGTWSLMGTELKEANCSPESKVYNLTNEGGYEYRFRYLKNIMGLWMIQSVKKEMGSAYSYEEICSMAETAKISSVIDVNAERFLSPENMTVEVKKACEESGQQIPETLAEVAAVIYNSLANCYRKTILEIEKMTGICFHAVQIIGGGSNAEYLNQLTARESGRVVYAGPGEATSVGNLAAQMIAAGDIQNLSEARHCVYKSFDIKKYSGRESE